MYNISMTTITVKVLKNGFSYFGGDGGIRVRKDATTIYNWVERKLGCLGRSLASSAKDKTVVRVFYPDGGLNETVTTQNPKEILFALAAFLEDFLPKRLLMEKYRKYA